MIRLLVCDDAPDARELVRALLSAQPSIEVVGEAANGEEAVARARELEPDVVLMDVEMPLLDGVDATRRIREILPCARIVAFAGSQETDTVMAMMEAGASAYCVKGAPAWELERAVVGAGDRLVRLAHSLARSLGESVKAELVAREAAELAHAAAATVFLLSPDGDLQAAGLTGTATGGSGTTNPDAVRRACAERSPAREGDTLAVPLLADGEALGALAVTVNSNADASTALLASVADLAAASLANERRLALSRAEARLDALTGLPNRRAFEERLDDLVTELNGRAGAVAAVIVDIDDFKRVNDTAGHAAGDEMLRRVGLVLRRTVRADEEVFRIGGEEFAIVVDGGRDAGLRVAERVRLALHGDRRGQPLPTISAGVAALPDDASTKDELLRRADAALYAAKWSGKDRVLAYGGAAVQPEAKPAPIRKRRILLVDDDAPFRALVRATVDPLDLDVDEAANTTEASARIAARRPDAIVLDVRMPGLDGISFCKQLKADATTRAIPVVLLTGTDVAGAQRAARQAGTDAFLRKPFSPLELLTVVERLLGASGERMPLGAGAARDGEQVLIYAHDLGRLLDLERGQRALLQEAYRETVTALATALESKDTGTRDHSQRVQRYASQLAAAVDPRLLDDASVEYGFLLHDVGKIGIPDRILLKPGPLTTSERRLMETHAVLGEQMLGKVALLRGEGLRVVRSHHERWDGRGYPDRLTGDEIPLGARIFAVADTLDAMTSDRPYRDAGEWEAAVREIVALSGRQFDPQIVEVFRDREEMLRRSYYEFAT
jgi:diguanylate cyclase (GGDEF)-like protein